MPFSTFELCASHRINWSFESQSHLGFRSRPALPCLWTSWLYLTELSFCLPDLLQHPTSCGHTAPGSQQTQKSRFCTWMNNLQWIFAFQRAVSFHLSYYPHPMDKETEWIDLVACRRWQSINGRAGSHPGTPPRKSRGRFCWIFACGHHFQLWGNPSENYVGASTFFT